MMHILTATELQNLVCGGLLLLFIIAFPILLYFLSKNYMDKSRLYWQKFYQRAVDKATKDYKKKDK